MYKKSLAILYLIGSILVISSTVIDGEACNDEKRDIYLVVDVSSSIGELRFTELKNWLMGIPDMFDLGPDKVRVGVIKFGTDVRWVVNPLWKASTDASLFRRQVKRRINFQQNSWTDLAGALKLQRDFLRTDWSRNNEGRYRYGVPATVVLITDGQVDQRVKPERNKQVAEWMAGNIRNSDPDTVVLQSIGVGTSEKGSQYLRRISDSYFEIFESDSIAGRLKDFLVTDCAPTGYPTGYPTTAYPSAYPTSSYPTAYPNEDDDEYNYIIG